MRELHDAQSIIEAAKQAAAAKDYPAAEAHLRKAVLLKEADLGPLHPDLASVVNNLGIVCEINDKPDDAEACFRRAFTIAIHALGPDHPLVATSRQNLRDFCDTRGKPFELPKRLRPPQAPRLSRPVQPRARTGSVRPFVIGMLGPAVMLIAIVAARPWLGSTEGHESSPAAVPPNVEPTQAATATAQTAERVTAAANDSPIMAPPITVQLTVVRAQLCATLEDWLCDPPDRPVPSGQLFFYTQVKATSATTVQHRWYQGDRLQHSVDLRVDASSGVGYRSFSRYTMTDGNAGDWRVELRSEDGLLLQEERFSVR